MANKSALEEYIGTYLLSRGKPSGALSFENYKAGRGIRYEEDYKDGVTRARAALLSSDPYRGSEAERLFSDGLGTSGYREHLAKKAKSTYEGTLKSLYEKRQRDEEKAIGGYASYLSDYKESRDSLIRSVRTDLMRNSIVNQETAFQYAISAGLSNEEARGVSYAVYEAGRDKIMAEAIEKATSLRLNGEAAALMAEKMGLTYEDSRAVAKEVDEYLGTIKEYTVPDEYLDKLEETSDGLTTTIKNRKD